MCRVLLDFFKMMILIKFADFRSPESLFFNVSFDTNMFDTEMDMVENNQVNTDFYDISVHNQIDDEISNGLESEQFKSITEYLMTPDKIQFGVSSNQQNLYFSQSIQTCNDSSIANFEISDQYSQNTSLFSELNSFLEIFDDSTAFTEDLLNEEKNAHLQKPTNSYQNYELIANTHTTNDFMEYIEELYDQPTPVEQPIKKTNEASFSMQKFQFYPINYQHLNKSVNKSIFSDTLDVNQSKNQEKTSQNDYILSEYILNKIIKEKNAIYSDSNIQSNHRPDDLLYSDQKNEKKSNLKDLFDQEDIFSDLKTSFLSFKTLFHDKDEDKLYREICSNSDGGSNASAYMTMNLNIFESLIDNLKLSTELNFLLLNNKFDLYNENLNTQLGIKLREIINATKTEIELNNCSSGSLKNTLIFKNNYLNNYCFFCKDEKCEMFNETYQYTEMQFSFLQLHLTSKYKSELHIVISEFLSNIYITKIFNLYSFLLFFMENRKVLFKLIRIMQIEKLHLNISLKINLLKEIFHNFKCHHSKIKIRLLQEFIPLFLFFLNRNITNYYQKDNIMFLLFVFYVQTFNHFLNIITKYNLFEETKNVDNNSQKIYTNLILLLLRINFVEPLIILSTRQKIFTLKYRFHILSLFDVQCLSLFKTNYDCQTITFFSDITYWILNIIERFNSTVFFKIYEQKNIPQLLLENKFYFQDLARHIIQIYFYEPYLMSDSFKYDTNFKKLHQFIKYIKTIR